MSSEDDGADLMAAFKGGKGMAGVPPRKRASVSPPMSFSEKSRPLQRKPASELPTRVAVAVRVSPLRNRDEFEYYEPKKSIARVLGEYQKKGELMYQVKLSEGQVKEISFDDLLGIEGGSTALDYFQQARSADSSSSSVTAEQDMRTRGRQNRKQTREEGMVDISQYAFSSDDELAATSSRPRQTRLKLLSGRTTDSSRSRTRSRRSDPDPIALTSSDDDDQDDDEDDDSDDGPKARRGKRKAVAREPTRRSGRARKPAQSYDDEDEDEEDEDSDDLDILRSDVFKGRKRKRGAPGRSEKIPRMGVRQSERSTRAQNNMQEANVDDIYRSDSEPRQTAPKIVSVKEVFETLPRTNLFRSRHVDGCETCGDGPNTAPLVYCQGCCLAYHKNCLGNRATREHLVTKIGDESFVLQCRRCVNTYQKKDSTAPNLAKCQDCHQHGASCQPFRKRKTSQQEQKEREDNGGQDPISRVNPKLVNNANNVLFRCTKCSRAWHYHHLPPLSSYSMDIVRDEEETADERFHEFSKHWLCKDCEDTQDKKVSTLIAWRPSDLETYRPGTPCHELNEDDKQYLVKWEEQSYFRASWHSGAWTWGVTAAAMRKAFFKREDGPKMRTEDAIPEEYLRIDIVLDVKYTSYVGVDNEEVDKARIKEVDKALIKYKGLGYEDAVWEHVPTPEDGDRWLDFVTAYNDWVAGRYVKYPKQNALKARVEKARATPFAKLEREKQPDNLVGGELMKYQIEGLNWLYYQWYIQRNGILADEMGLGKTIQVIGFMATLIQEHHCFPFLIVVPNSTCANWRREIKQWVPSLRVVTYFGSAAARDMAHKYELYPNGAKEIRAHIVVTSYEAAADESCRRVLRQPNWAGLIVDEGQRLKNDKSQLYGALNAVRAPFRLLLTGTPLQNNARELFNLLQFLDDSINAADLEEKYAEMTTENVRELHEQIRPFILRRTKAQVLTFLPALGQIIVPISMSTLQKTLYKNILAKNPELLKALFTTSNLKQQERANLSNILMQLRKCLCHPFVYSREIEERTDVQAVSHRNLVEASAKLQFLELLLPKLKERGHRVLIFSQFLDMLDMCEDFLDGMLMPYQRLDGRMGSLEKQKRIDQFNAPDSPLFVFLLSTRAGGVGINLATADTVIILDPDFNPHQDIQAISRAHRIGQKKKVLCFQLMTRASAEEKIVQMGRGKMALDHVVVEQLDAEDMGDQDVQSILKYGAAELFKDDGANHDIRYDDASIEKLLDRSQIENTKTGHDNTADSQFSFARVWANDRGGLADDLEAPEEEIAPDPGVWEKILQERAAAAAAEALARSDALGRGKRARMNVDYNQTEQDAIAGELAEASPVKDKRGKKKKNKNGSESDTDFQAEESQAEDEESAEEVDLATVLEQPKVLEAPVQRERKTSSKITGSLYKQNGSGTPSKFPPVTVLPSKFGFKAPRSGKRAVPSGPPTTVTDKHHKRPMISLSTAEEAKAAINATLRKQGALAAAQLDGAPANLSSLAQRPSWVSGSTINGTPAANGSPVKPFARAQLPIRTPLEPTYGQWQDRQCPACRQSHPRGACPLKLAGPEHCGLCGLAHFGHARQCPHIRSETQVREMLQALKSSPEQRDLVEAAMKYLRGVKGTLVQQKKKDREKALGISMGGAQGPPVMGYPGAVRPVHQGGQSWQDAQRVPGPRPPPNVTGPASSVSGQPTGHTNGQQHQRAGGQAANMGRPIEDPDHDHVVANALRGFLGQNMG